MTAVVRRAILGFMGAFAPAALAGTNLVVYTDVAPDAFAPILQHVDAFLRDRVVARYDSDSAADVFVVADPDHRARLAAQGRLQVLPDELVDGAPERFRASDRRWVAVAAHVQVVAFNAQLVKESDLPDDLWGLCAAVWKSRVGWAPNTASFRALISALAESEGADRAQEWLRLMKTNETVSFMAGSDLMKGLVDGRVDVALTTHDSLLTLQDERGPGIPIRNYVLRKSLPATRIVLTCAGVSSARPQNPDAQELVRYLLSPQGQALWTGDHYAYPLAGNVSLDPRLAPLPDGQPVAGPPIDVQGLLEAAGIP